MTKNKLFHIILIISILLLNSCNDTTTTFYAEKPYRVDGVDYFKTTVANIQYVNDTISKYYIICKIKSGVCLDIPGRMYLYDKAGKFQVGDEIKFVTDNLN